MGFGVAPEPKRDHLRGHRETQEVINIRSHQMTDGIKQEDDTLSGGSELITVCLGLIHRSIVENELALKRNLNL